QGHEHEPAGAVVQFDLACLCSCLAAQTSDCRAGRARRSAPGRRSWLKENEVGPIVSQRQFDRVLGFIDSAKTEGAKLLTGGGKPSDQSLTGGFFIAPTVFDSVAPAMRIAREEIFGPVMSVMAWNDYEDMLEKVNGVEYGLTAAIVTNDLAKA